MEIDTLYRVPKDLCWRYVKAIAKPNSIGLIFYRACVDSYVTNKTILNALTRLSEGGFMCIECLPENAHSVIKAIDMAGYRYFTLPAVGPNRWAIYVVAYKNESLKPKCGRLIRISSWENIATIFAHLIPTEDIVLAIGDAMLPFVPVIKSLNHYVIAMGDDPIFNVMVQQAGLRERLLV